jgi:3-oxoacyl-[acyl-carrier-protein] synthase III
MMYGKPIRILGTGKYVPQIVPSEVLESKYGLPEGWSETHSGVRSRYHVGKESSAEMGAKALEMAMEMAGVSLPDLDLIISGSASFDYPLPHQSSAIKREMKDGLNCQVPTMDVGSSCLSFLSAFEVAASLLNGQSYRKIAIVSSEIASKGINPDNWETLTLFGDGAAACILGFEAEGDSRFYMAVQRTYSEGFFDSIIKGGGNKHFFKDYPYDPALHSFGMHGKNLLRLALKTLPEFLQDFFAGMPISVAQIDCIIPHQASKSGIGLLQQIVPELSDKVKQNLLTHGNCIAASIPILLHDLIHSGEIKRGYHCFFIGTAAGVSVGGMLIKY